MSWEDVDLNHSSSVHLRDLGKLVSAFSEKQHSPFEVNADEQLSRFLVPDGVTSQRMSCNSDDQRLNKPSFTHVNARLHEAENILLAEHFNENTREEKITGESPLELASTSDLCEATQEKNSLYLINELCDRLIAKASQSSERNDDYLKTEAISDTPIICAAERSTYSEACEQISYSVPNTYESYYGFIDDNSHLSILNTSHNGSHDSMSVPSEQNGTIMLSIEKTSYATEISGQNCLAKKHQALESNKPTGAISQIQQMVEQLSPPLERIPLTQGPDVISELSHDDTPQCNSLECHDIHDTGNFTIKKKKSDLFTLRTIYNACIWTYSGKSASYLERVKNDALKFPIACPGDEGGR